MWRRGLPVRLDVGGTFLSWLGSVNDTPGFGTLADTADATRARQQAMRKRGESAGCLAECSNGLGM